MEQTDKINEADENISNLLLYKPRADKIASEISEMLTEWN